MLDHILSTKILAIEIQSVAIPAALKLRNCTGRWGRSITWILLQVVPHPLWPYEKMISPSVKWCFCESIDSGNGWRCCNEPRDSLIFCLLCLVFFSDKMFGKEMNGQGIKLNVPLKATVPRVEWNDQNEGVHNYESMTGWRSNRCYLQSAIYIDFFNGNEDSSLWNVGRPCMPSSGCNML